MISHCIKHFNHRPDINKHPGLLFVRFTVWSILCASPWVCQCRHGVNSKVRELPFIPMVHGTPMNSHGIPKKRTLEKKSSDPIYFCARCSNAGWIERRAPRQDRDSLPSRDESVAVGERLNLLFLLKGILWNHKQLTDIPIAMVYWYLYDIDNPMVWD